ncbi:MAG: FAD-dependent oxidoreductase [Cyclobacteriaceae bacterium]
MKTKEMIKESKYEVVVVGGTPGGVASAITAARLGHKVALIESHKHLGGMTASGLGKSDVEQKEFIGGLFREFTSKVLDHYKEKFGATSEEVKLCREGYYFEPSVAELVLNQMISDTKRITVLTHHMLKDAGMEGKSIKYVSVINRSNDELLKITGGVFIDATYEGDLYAMAGADYRLGREGRTDFNEPHAGEIFYDYENGKILGGSGAGDDRVQAYTYRYCFTKDTQNCLVLEEPPVGYDRALYAPYFEDLNSGRFKPPKEFHEGWGYYPEHFNTMVRAWSVTDLPNGKVDANTNPRALAFPFPEVNKGYIEGDADKRRQVSDDHRQISLGLIWFLQNDKEIHEEHRKMAGQYHLPLDEFTDNNHFPFQLYVREGRRLKGEYTITQHDVAITEEAPGFMKHHDTIAMGEFPVDSFPVTKRPDKENIVLEGYLGMMAHLTRPYEIPYRAMLPTSVDGLIVPVALSATHVGFCSVRMEPTWMSLGQAAGVAAHVCLQSQTQPRNVKVGEVRKILESQGQVLSNESAVD